MLNFLHSLMRHILTTKKFTFVCNIVGLFCPLEKMAGLPTVLKVCFCHAVLSGICVHSSQTILPLEMDQPLNEGRKMQLAPDDVQRSDRSVGRFLRC